MEEAKSIAADVWSAPVAVSWTELLNVAKAETESAATIVSCTSAVYINPGADAKGTSEKLAAANTLCRYKVFFFKPASLLNAIGVSPCD